MYIVRPITMETLWGDTRLHSYQGDRAAQTIGCVYTLSGIDGIDCEIYNAKELVIESNKFSNTEHEDDKSIIVINFQ